MSKTNFLYGLLLVTCFTLVGCGPGKPEVVVNPDEMPTEQEVEDYEAEMDAGDPIEE